MAVNALVLVANGCAHCASVLDNLMQLVKTGALSELRVVNISLDNTLAEKLGVRSVPWLQLGEFQFDGQYTLAELSDWAALADTTDGLKAYFVHLISSGTWQKVYNRILQDPNKLEVVLELLADPETELHIRIGLMAIFEELQVEGWLNKIIPQLSELLASEHSFIRIDACHILSLIDDPAIIPIMTKCLQDNNPDIREIAEEVLEKDNA